MHELRVLRIPDLISRDAGAVHALLADLPGELRDPLAHRDSETAILKDAADPVVIAPWAFRVDAHLNAIIEARFARIMTITMHKEATCTNEMKMFFPFVAYMKLLLTARKIIILC